MKELNFLHPSFLSSITAGRSILHIVIFRITRTKYEVQDDDKNNYIKIWCKGKAMY